MIEASTLVTAMTAAQLRAVLYPAFIKLWQDGGLPHEALSSMDGLVESAVEALTQASREDDLDLADDPLDVISGSLRATGALGRDDADEVGVLVYEALIDAGHLPGVNAQRHSSDSLDSEEEIL